MSTLTERLDDFRKLFCIPISGVLERVRGDVAYFFPGDNLRPRDEERLIGDLESLSRDSELLF